MIKDSHNAYECRVADILTVIEHDYIGRTCINK